MYGEIENQVVKARELAQQKYDEENAPIEQTVPEADQAERLDVEPEEKKVAEESAITHRDVSDIEDVTIQDIQTRIIPAKSFGHISKETDQRPLEVEEAFEIVKID